VIICISIALSSTLIKGENSYLSETNGIELNVAFRKVESRTVKDWSVIGLSKGGSSTF
jgi:hypothetical protein